MKAYLNCVQKGGGETDYYFETDMPQAPAKGDWIRVIDEDQPETGNRKFMRDFTVGQVEWEFIKQGQNLEFAAIRVECEFALSARSCDEHRRSYEIYTKSTGQPNELRETMF